ncbi:hypothetical protein IH982_01670 [Patescibacteria group bacterium]|nr:hypothetical protein [Patescibacteria group bacterium]
MATNVVKRDGSKQPFDEGKIRRSIKLAVQDAALSSDRTDEVVNQVLPIALAAANSKEEIATSELREVILAELEKTEASAAEAWRKYAQSKGA